MQQIEKVANLMARSGTNGNSLSPNHTTSNSRPDVILEETYQLDGSTSKDPRSRY